MEHFFGGKDWYQLCMVFDTDCGGYAFLWYTKLCLTSRHFLSNIDACLSFWISSQSRRTLRFIRVSLVLLFRVIKKLNEKQKNFVSSVLLWSKSYLSFHLFSKTFVFIRCQYPTVILNWSIWLCYELFVHESKLCRAQFWRTDGCLEGSSDTCKRTIELHLLFTKMNTSGIFPMEWPI
jgi:hypothetical protein